MNICIKRLLRNCMSIGGPGVRELRQIEKQLKEIANCVNVTTLVQNFVLFLPLVLEGVKLSKA